MELKKLTLLKNLYLWQYLDEASQEKFIQYCDKQQLSFQRSKQLLDISRDFQMWGIPSPLDKGDNFDAINQKWSDLKKSKVNYSGEKPSTPKTTRPLQSIDSGKKIFGTCPVASEKTLCCQLRTIDAVQNCNYQCSYCSIQTFYQDNKISFEENLKEKLNEIDLDPQTLYHFGTGQSSDSLMWGNHNKTIEHLIGFARNNPNVLLEFKTKSQNIKDFLELSPPKNVVCSWSINPQTIIENEELYTANLNERLNAAKKVHDQGHPVSFHFHPIVYFEGYEKEYTEIIKRITTEFDPSRVLFISLGTLTFIKSAIKSIRSKGHQSKILMLPLEEANGRFSYPDHIKLEIFKTVYDLFKPWHGKVFYYLCMEAKELWMPVFGFDFKDNNEFEKEMLKDSFKKVNNLALS